MNKKRTLIIALLAIALVGVILSGYKWWSGRDSSPSSVNPDNAINYDPPTDEEVAEGETIKKETIDEENNQNNTPQASKTNVTPILGYLESNLDGVSANGYVSEFVESDGTCTLILTNGSETVTEQKTAMPDAQSTICGQIFIGKDRLNSGIWEAKISYESPAHEGVSEPKKVEVK